MTILYKSLLLKKKNNNKYVLITNYDMCIIFINICENIF